MKQAIVLSIVIILAISISGCIGQNSGQNLGSGIAVRYEANPSTIYEKGQAIVYMDVENVDISAVDASIDIFNTGIFSYADRERCRALYNDFLPKEIKSMECRLNAPDEIAKQMVTTNLDYKAVLNKKFSAPLSFDIIGQGMYIEQEKAGTLRYGQQAYIFSDPNMAVNVEFSKQPPFVLRAGEKVLMYVKIRSLGPGFLSDIDVEKRMFLIDLQNQADENVNLICDFPVLTDKFESTETYKYISTSGSPDTPMGKIGDTETGRLIGYSGTEKTSDFSIGKLIAIKGEFPPITCEINVPEVYSKLNDAKKYDELKNYLRSFMLIIKYNYDYEIRGTIPLVVSK